jgi:outer membrane protein, heavy metal efflux system
LPVQKKSNELTLRQRLNAVVPALLPSKHRSCVVRRAFVQSTQKSSGENVKRKFVFPLILVAAFATGGWAQEAAAPLTLQAAVDTYIAKNLELQAARYRLERTRADQIAARLRPNPALTISAQNLKINGPAPPFNGLYEFETSYSDTIELGGKRKLRETAADASVSAAEAQFADTMRHGIAQVKRLYYDALLAKYNVDIAIENRQTFEELVQFNLARFREGAIAESEVIKVRLERIKYDTAIKDAELLRRQAAIRLLGRLGESTFNKEIGGPMEFRRIDADSELLKQASLLERSDIQAAQRELDAANERLVLEQARAKPDLMPFVGYKRIASDNTVLFGVSMPLKTRDRNQAGIARALAEQKAAEVQLQLTRNRAMAEVEGAYAAFRTAREQVETFRNELLNEADESRSIALAAYQEGATQLLPLLDAQRTRTDVRRQYFRTLFDYQTSIVDLELAVGKELQ